MLKLTEALSFQRDLSLELHIGLVWLSQLALSSWLQIHPESVVIGPLTPNFRSASKVIHFQVLSQASG